MRSAKQWIDETAPADVVETIRSLERAGYELTHSEISTSFGNGQLRFSGEFGIVITRDRGQWSLDVIMADGETFQLDLIAAGRAGRYPTQPIEGTPLQLPPWISWHEELPGLLDWIKAPGARDRVRDASDERYLLMWPDSPKARSIQAKWTKQRIRDLNRLYIAAIAFGKNWLRPINELSDEIFAGRAQTERTELAVLVESARTRIEEFVRLQYESDATDSRMGTWNRDKHRDTQAWIKSEFPWMRHGVARRAELRATYYAWHG